MTRILHTISRDLLSYAILTALFSGVCIAWYYVPLPDRAPLALDHLRQNVFGGKIMLDLHRFSAALALLSAIIVCGTTAFADADVRIKRAAILSSLLLFVLIAGDFITGLLLTHYTGWQRTTSQASALPPLFDDGVLPFVRIYLAHALFIPAAIVMLYLFRHVSSGKNRRESTPVIRHSTRFSAFVTVLIFISYVIREFSGR
ncbi:MAG: hypothetical protein MUF22_02260 [Chitinispirillaceae bacterium]|jgi:hypothetical protein|nr:hypothetical protein [Chitinispirillaceae bacterium]